MLKPRDGHVRVLPIHVANKIAAGEVVERPASVVKELVENAIDAGAKSIKISIVQGGRKLVSVQDDGCGMSREDALLSLERQATSKILDVDDIEEIDTLGFRGEAIPSIASVSRFAITTRRHDADEAVRVEVNAGILSIVRSAGAPAGTLVEVRDLFCNVPARRKFLRAFQTEETHVRQIFTVHALAHPSISFSLFVDEREVARLPSAKSLEVRVRELFGKDFVDSLLPLEHIGERVCISGFIERPNLNTPTRKGQYIFINGRPATAPAVAYALKEAFPCRQGDVKPAAVIFISLPPKDVDVNVHPTKREVRFRDNVAVRNALMAAIGSAAAPVPQPAPPPQPPAPPPLLNETPNTSAQVSKPFPKPLEIIGSHNSPGIPPQPAPSPAPSPAPPSPPAPPAPSPVPLSLPLAKVEKAKPWAYFKYLATTETGYVLLETDSGIVTLNPRAARERIAYEKLLGRTESACAVQQLLIPETVHLNPADCHRVSSAIDTIRAMGFSIEPFGADTFKIDAVPVIVSSMRVSDIIETIAADLSTAQQGGRGGARWREEAIAKSVARSYAGASPKLDSKSAEALVGELIACRMPYVCPRGKSVMIFTSIRELDRKFGKS